MRDHASPPADYAIDVQGLTKRFARRLAIDRLSLTVRHGDIWGLAGANGGGKSTSLRLLAGLMAPDEGEGTVLGCNLRQGACLIRQRVGYLAQHCTLYATLSVRENLRFRAAVFGLSDPALACNRQISAFGLGEFASALVGQLSGGWSRQVELAAALIHRPRLLLLDEPTVGLDPAARHAIWRTLAALAGEGTAIVLTTHDLAEAERCSHIVLLSDGRVRARGSPKAVVSQIEAAAMIVSGQNVRNLAELLQTPLVMAADPLGNDIRLVVAAESLQEIKTLLANRGHTSIPATLTLEDAALVVARRSRIAR